jgi:diguanylate cyclase (GGDEF)-like protein
MIAYVTILYVSPNLPTTVLLIAFFLPVNFVLWLRVKSKSILGKFGFRYLAIIIFEISSIYFLSSFWDNSGSNFFREMYVEIPRFSYWLEKVFGYFIDFVTYDLLFPDLMLYLPFFIVLSVMFAQYFKIKKVATAYNIVLLLSIMNGVVAYRNQVHVYLYFTAGAIILLIATIESSFYLAYIDELTNLPGRRKFNESMLNLGKKFTIAMIDVDHFKKFNDTYGHKSGDQALRMVAAKLNLNQGSGKAYRYGGEEFTMIFPGKTIEEALPVLEECRQAIEKALFIIREKDRKFRNEEHRGKKKLSKIKKTKITVSIGVAQSDNKLSTPEQVLKAADKNLYKAKHLGRNRVHIDRSN